MTRSAIALAAFALVILAFGLSLDAVGQVQKKKKPGFPVPKKVDGDPQHDPANAVANLDVHPELEATLFASEPTASPIPPTSTSTTAAGSGSATS